MSDIKLENNTFKAINLLQDQAIQFLYEAGGELQAQVKRNTRVDSGQLKGSWEYIVDEGDMKVTVGSPLQNAIWEEFGTGEHALDGKGRKTPWYIPVDTYDGKKKPTYNGKVVIVYGKNGQAFYKTDGKKPNRALQNAIDKTMPKLKKRLEQLMRG